MCRLEHTDPLSCGKRLRASAITSLGENENVTKESHENNTAWVSSKRLQSWGSICESTDDEADEDYRSHESDWDDGSSCDEVWGYYDDEEQTTARPSVRFSEATPEVFEYEAPPLSCHSSLYYTCHQLQQMSDEYYAELTRQIAAGVVEPLM